jgi:hypothetical protein
MDIGWKLFEVDPHDRPKSLVHGMPGKYGVRTRIFSLDAWINREYGTKGFNFFNDFNAMQWYLPRFRVRGKKLVACRIEVLDRCFAPLRSNYALATQIYIPTDEWADKILGEDLL